MKAYVTKYALTKGILAVDDAEWDSRYPQMIKVPSLGIFACFHGEGKDWHRTERDAQIHAEIMRLKEIKRLERQIKKLRAMNTQSTLEV